VLVASLGVAALLRAAVPLHPVTTADTTQSMPGMQMGPADATQSDSAGRPAGGSAGTDGAITVTGAFVAEPANPSVVAVYLTFTNNTGTDDRLVKVQSGAALSATIHAGESMAVAPQGLTLPAHKKVGLSVGDGHIMLTNVIGAIRPGQTVDLELFFEKASELVVVAPVIAIGAPTPKEG
jgi:copper(I)-binding protein